MDPQPKTGGSHTTSDRATLATLITHGARGALKAPDVWTDGPHSKHPPGRRNLDGCRGRKRDDCPRARHSPADPCHPGREALGLRPIGNHPTDYY